MTSSLYDILGVHRTADANTITKAYRRRAMKFHPDRNPGDADAAAKYAQVQDAYDVLHDPERRKQYDKDGTTKQAPPKPPPEAEVATIIVPFLYQVLQECEASGSITNVNVVQRIKDKLSNCKYNAEEGLRRCERALRILKQAAGWFTVAEGETNILAQAVDGEINSVQGKIDRIKADLDKMVRVNKYLDKCKFKVDDPFGFSTTTAPVWGFDMTAEHVAAIMMDVGKIYQLPKKKP